jgi:arginine repressor
VQATGMRRAKRFANGQQLTISKSTVSKSLQTIGLFRENREFGQQQWQRYPFYQEIVSRLAGDDTSYILGKGSSYFWARDG